MGEVDFSNVLNNSKLAKIVELWIGGVIVGVLVEKITLVINDMNGLLATYLPATITNIFIVILVTILNLLILKLLLVFSNFKNLTSLSKDVFSRLSTKLFR